MANFWGDVAKGAATGYQMGLQGRRMAMEEEEFAQKRKEWEDAQAYKQELKDAGQTANLETKKGLQVTASDGTSFYVPDEAAAKAYVDGSTFDKSYSYDPTQRNYQEVNAGSRSLGQYAGTEDPTANQKVSEYNAGGLQRQSAVANKYGKFSDAASLESLQNAPLQRQALQNQLDMAPGQKRLQDIQIAAADLKQGWADARAKGLPGMLEFYDNRVGDGHKSRVKTGADGTVHVYRDAEDGSGSKLWQSFKPQFGLSAEQIAAAVIDGHMGDDKTLLKIAEMNMNNDLRKAMYASKGGYTPSFSQAGTLTDGTPVIFDQREGSYKDGLTGKPLSSGQVKLFQKVTGEKPQASVKPYDVKKSDGSTVSYVDTPAGPMPFDQYTALMAVPKQEGGAQTKAGGKPAKSVQGSNGSHPIENAAEPQFPQKNKAVMSRVSDIDSQLLGTTLPVDERVALEIEKQQLLTGDRPRMFGLSFSPRG
jgi:hypothetical protein